MKQPLALLILLLFLGCAHVDPGDAPVDMERLGKTLADLHLAEAISQNIPIMVKDSMAAVYYDSVLADHGYTRAEFDSIMWILRQEPVWIDSAYTRAGIIVAKDMIEM